MIFRRLDAFSFFDSVLHGVARAISIELVRIASQHDYNPGCFLLLHASQNFHAAAAGHSNVERRQGML
jgi:hypothetical protein